MSDKPEQDEEAPSGIVLADGTVIGEDGKAKKRPLEAPKIDHTLQVVQEKRAHELPSDSSKQMNVVAAVTAYHLFGLPPGDIARNLKTERSLVEMVQKSAEFNEMKTVMLQQLANSLSAEVRGMLTNFSAKAAATIIEQLDHDHPGIQFNAAKDVLDRAGHRPADIVEHRHSVDGGLRIEFVNRDAPDRLSLDDVEVIDAE